MAQITPKLPTTGIYSGLQAANYINDGFATLLTRYLGSSTPSDAPNGIPAAGQNWIDTSVANYQLLKGYTGSAFVLEHAIDTVNNILLNPIGGGTASIASASTTDLGSKNEAYQTITGTTTITSFGTNVPQGQAKILTFGGTLQLTYNATSMILPGAANISTAAGDIAIMVSLGSGNWKCIFYGRISGANLTMTGATATVASASTTDLASGGSNAIAVSGTTTITSFGSNATLANPYYFVRFTGALILTHNATSLIIPGGQNITTTAGDWLVAEYLGSGNWRVCEYQKSNGQAISMAGADTTIASNTTTTLTTASNVWNITGTTTITSFGTAASTANPVYFVRFTGALQLTYHATSMILPGAANITTAAGDSAVFLYAGSGNWRCLNYQKASGQAVVATSSVAYGQIAGCLPSSITGTNTTAALSVSAGQAADSTNTAYIASAGYSWAVSNGNAINGYEGGTTLPNSSTIHFFLCTGNSGTGTFASTSLTPTLPSGYNTYYRRIFSLQTTGAGALIPGNSIEGFGGAQIFYLTTQVLDINNQAPNTASRSLYTLSVPTGIKVQPLFRANPNTGENGAFILTSPDETDVAPSTFTTSNFYTYWSSVPGDDAMGNQATDSVIHTGFLTTNTSGQIGIRMTGSSHIWWVTRGWVDFRR